LPPSTTPIGCGISSPGFNQPLCMCFIVCVLASASVCWLVNYSTPHSFRCFNIPSVVAIG
jgi:hypothetical protein